jgi:cysteinyl-tRNA synthetase
VKHVRNYTDVGHLTSDSDTGVDKMEKGAKREGKTPDEIAEKYIDIFEKDTKSLNLLEPTFKPRATEYIQQMMDMITTLFDKGFAYTTDLAVYFDVTKFTSYTNLSHQQMDKLQEGAGKADVSDPRKKHAADFALWFFKAGVHAGALQYWKSPFQSLLVRDGVGFPGWHIECSAMSKALLGNTIDVHLGGVEHIPVHNTNEIAQSESANGVKFVNFWLHNEHLLVNDKKMAKSEGTGFSLQEVVDHGYDPITLRYFFLQAHYRSKQNFTWEALEASKKSLMDLRYMMESWKNKEMQGDNKTQMQYYTKEFTYAIEEDLNISKALAITWEMIKSTLDDGSKRYLLLDFDRVLGLGLAGWKQEEIPKNILQLVNKRNELRKEKKFGESDVIRKQIENLGYVIEDSSEGVRIKKA